jgi:hypothetical protein
MAETPSYLDDYRGDHECGDKLNKYSREQVLEAKKLT